MKLGNFLVKAGVLKRAQLDEALQHQVLHGARLGTCLVELGMISIDTLAQQLAQFHGVPVPGRQQLEKVSPAAARRLTRALVEKRRVLPLRLEGTSALHVAMLDPHDPATLDDLRFVARARIVPYVLPELVMHDWLDWLFQVPRTLRYVDLSHTKATPPPLPREAAPAKSGRPGTLRGVGKDGGLDMGRWDAKAQSASAGKSKSADAFAATLKGVQQPAVARDMADALNQLVPIHAEPAVPSVLSVAPPAPPSALSSPPPRDTQPPPALVLPNTPPVASSSRRPGGGTWPGAGAAKVVPAPKSGKSGTQRAASVPPPAAVPVAAAAPGVATAPGPVLSPPVSEERGEAPVEVVAPAAAERPASVGVATWAVALEAAVREAQDRDELVDAALRLGALYAEVFAVFAVHRGMVQGVRGFGPNGEVEGLSGILIDEATTCQLTAPVTSGEARRFALEERSVEERILHVMGRQVVREAAVFPVRLRQRTVNLLYADNGAEALPQSCFGALEQVAQCMAAGYEQLILRKRGS